MTRPPNGALGVGVAQVCDEIWTVDEGSAIFAEVFTVGRRFMYGFGQFWTHIIAVQELASAAAHVIKLYSSIW